MAQTSEGNHWLVEVGQRVLSAWPQLDRLAQLKAVIAYGGCVECFGHMATTHDLLAINEVLRQMIAWTWQEEAEWVRRH